MQNILLSCFFRCVNLCFCPGRWDGDRAVLMRKDYTVSAARAQTYVNNNKRFHKKDK